MKCTKLIKKKNYELKPSKTKVKNKFFYSEQHELCLIGVIIIIVIIDRIVNVWARINPSIFDV